MKLDLAPVRSTYVAPTFGSDVTTPLDPQLERRLRRPMVVGAGIIGTLVVGLSLWASLTPLANGVTAPGQVTVEANRKTIRHKETGTVRQILVKEGQLVKAGQPLLMFDDTDAKAAYSILQNQADTLMAQVARLSAEATDKPVVSFPAELTGRISDPTVAGLIRDQEFLFTSRLQLFQSQSQVLQQRLDQIQNQIRGDQAQLDSAEEQRKLTVDEMSGYQTLYEKGYAPKQLILRYQRQVADLQGKKGSLLADIARLHQQMGETKMQLASLRDQRQSQAAEQLRDSQSKLEETLPRLVSAKQSYEETVVRSPTDGYVFNQTTFTPGGVAGGGEQLMEIVPSNSPMTVTVMIKPEDIDKIHAGMDARVRIVGPNPRWANPIPATVAVVSADRMTNKETGASFFRAELHIAPKDLKDFEKNVKVTPGMTAQAMIVTGENTIMGSLMQPITDTMHHALRDQ
jgi:HlyD family type I secretion membrane fusion protein